MAHHLFNDFLGNLESYRACEQFWENLVQGVSKRVGYASDWRRWIPRSYANGTAMELDGNPIWDGRSAKLDRAYRIIQMPAEDERVQIGAWLSRNDSDNTELPSHELVIVLALSMESAQLAANLLEKWMDPGATPEQMSRFIDQSLPQNE